MTGSTPRPVVGLDPVVSVITVSYNSQDTIADTIESVLGQDHPAVEYIVIDGGSTDGTRDIVASYGDGVTRFVSEPDQGIYDAMNKGIRLATGDIVATLNSDDLYSGSDAVSTMVDAMERAGADAGFADIVMVERDDLSRVRRYYDASGWKPSRFRWGWMPPHPSFFVRRRCYEEHGLYSLDYQIGADFEMLVRLLYRAGASYTYVPRPIVRMRLGGISTGGLRQNWILNREIVRACRTNGLWTSLPLLAAKVPGKLLEMLWTDRRT